MRDEHFGIVVEHNQSPHTNPVPKSPKTGRGQPTRILLDASIQRPGTLASNETNQRADMLALMSSTDLKHQRFPVLLYAARDDLE